GTSIFVISPQTFSCVLVRVCGDNSTKKNAF
ncbi:MAG: hypothetical protein ACI90V_009129, partial [Bacillariaceae sp.]